MHVLHTVRTTEDLHLTFNCNLWRASCTFECLIVKCKFQFPVLSIFSIRSISENLNEVLDAMFHREVAEGENIITQGDDGDNFYVIERCVQDGQVEAHCSRLKVKHLPSFRYRISWLHALYCILWLTRHVRLIYLIFQRQIQHLRKRQAGRRLRRARQLRGAGSNVQHASSCHHTGTGPLSTLTEDSMTWSKQ